MTVDIELKGVTLTFSSDGGRKSPVYEDFNLEVEQGSFTVLLGPSGCGKSTLLNVIDGLLTPTRADSVKVVGRDIREVPDVTRQVGYIFQSPRLLKWRTLRENVVFGMRGLKSKPKSEWPELIERYFSMVGLADAVDLYPSQVSGGMEQRAAIVRAWVNEPKILLMDEPFSHLDEITAAEMRQQLANLWSRDEPRRTVVFVTHDISEAVELGERVIMLTQRPATICLDQTIDLPYPRRPDDRQVIEMELKLRKALLAGRPDPQMNDVSA